MRTFENRKAERKFAEVLEAMLGEKRRERFVDDIKSLRDKKVTSEEGAFKTYLVNEVEVINIAKKYI